MKRISTSSSTVREYDNDGAVTRDERVEVETRLDSGVSVEHARFYCGESLVGRTETTTSPGHMSIRRWDYEAMKFSVITREEFALPADADADVHEEWPEYLGEIG
jgi:hypothetical protein